MGGVTAASWKWYSAMDEAIGGRPSITPPTLIASSGLDVAVTSPSSVRSERERVGRKRKDFEELIREMEEREAERERDAIEREERQRREMEEKEERKERERREHEKRLEQEARERDERRDREPKAVCQWLVGVTSRDHCSSEIPCRLAWVCNIPSYHVQPRGGPTGVLVMERRCPAAVSCKTEGCTQIAMHLSNYYYCTVRITAPCGLCPHTHT
ncbi:unnamed protein product [Leuciscus chuanchicus]